MMKHVLVNPKYCSNVGEPFQKMSFEILPGHLLSHLLSPVPVRGLASLSRSSNSLDALVWQNLAELTLSPQTTKDATLIQLSQKPLIHLTTLNLMGCTKITDQGCRNLAKIASLRNLNLKYCDQITDEWIEELVSKLSLSQLNLAYCFQITNISLQILSSAPYLTQLDLSDCDEITTEGLAHLSKLKLTHLKLSYCNKLTDESAQVLSIMVKREK